jgi:hypothetical protein
MALILCAMVGLSRMSYDSGTGICDDSYFQFS